MIGFFLAAGLAAATTPTAYNAAIDKAAAHSTAGDGLLVSSDDALKRNDLPAACAALSQAMVEWQLASVGYLKAGASPADVRDDNRLDDDGIKALTDALIASGDQAQKIYDENCKP